MMLKTNLHFHSAEDPLDLFITHTIYEGIDIAKKEGFKVLAMTCHDKFMYRKEYGDYAREQGMLLIPGIEIEIKRGHVLILNADKEAESIKSFAALKRYKEKRKDIFVIAPHPYFGMFSLNKKLERNIKLFDAVEYHWFFGMLFDRNKKAKRVAEKYNKPYISTSDTHNIKYLHKGFALIDSPKFTIKSVFNAIRRKKFNNVVERSSWFSLASYLVWYNISQLKVLAKGLIGISTGRINIRIPFVSRDSMIMSNAFSFIIIFLGLSYFLFLK